MGSNTEKGTEMGNVVELFTKIHCDCCGKLCKTSTPNGKFIENGAELRLIGGYNQFFDHLTDAHLSLTMCHDCTLQIFRIVSFSEKYASFRNETLNREHYSEIDGEYCCEFGFGENELDALYDWSEDEDQ